MTKKEQKFFDLKIRFNDVMMRELGLDITEDKGYLYDMETESILQIKEKFIKYVEDEYSLFKHNEIEMNLLENPKLTEILVLPYISRFCDRNNITLQSISQSPMDTNTHKGYFILSYIIDGQVKEFRSDAYANESVRIFNFICKINKTENLYKFNDFDVEIPRSSRG